MKILIFKVGLFFYFSSVPLAYASTCKVESVVSSCGVKNAVSESNLTEHDSHLHRTAQKSTNIGKAEFKNKKELVVKKKVPSERLLRK